MGHRPNKAPEKCNVTEAQDKAFKIASVNKFMDLKEDRRTQKWIEMKRNVQTMKAEIDSLN